MLGEVGGKLGVTANGHRVSLGADENALFVVIAVKL